VIWAITKSARNIKEVAYLLRNNEFVKENFVVMSIKTIEE
jgi:hypothetical protein